MSRAFDDLGVEPPDLAAPDLFGADFSGVDLSVTVEPDLSVSGPDLASSDIAPLDLPGNSLVVLAGQYGGPGSHDDVGTDARFNTLEGAVRIGNLLYVAEHWSGHVRTVDLTTRQTATLNLIRASDSMPTTLHEPAGIVYDGAGFLYVACFGEHTIRKIELSTRKVSLVIGLVDGPGSDDGAASVARFNEPWGLVFDGAGYLWVSDSVNQRLRKIDLAGPTVSTPELVDYSPTDMGVPTTFVEPHGMTRSGPFIFISDDGGVVRLDPTSLVVSPFVAKDTLDWATDVAVVGTDLYAIDFTRNALWRFPLTAPQSGTMVAGGNTFIESSYDGIGSAARFYHPEYLVAGASNDLFVVENAAIRRVTLDTFNVTTFAGLGEHSGFRNGADPLLFNPAGVLYDGADTLYFSEYTDGNRVRRYSFTTHEVSAVAGNGDPEHLDGPAASAGFYGPGGMALDNDGNLYIVEDLVHTVRKLDKLTNMVSTIAGTANVTGKAGADGLAGTANKLDAPCGLLFDGDHTLFLSERGNSQIRTIDLASGTYAMSLLLGTGVRSADDDPDGKLASFDGPCGMAYNRTTKKLYIAETNADTVRVADLASVNHPVTTLSGTAYGPFSVMESPGDNGPLAATRHRTAVRLALSADGNRLYVSNLDGDSVQELDLANNLSRTVIGVSLQGFVRPGTLPGGVHRPDGIALTPAGLAVVSSAEHTLLLATRNSALTA